MHVAVEELEAGWLAGSESRDGGILGGPMSRGQSAEKQWLLSKWKYRIRLHCFQRHPAYRRRAQGAYLDHQVLGPCGGPGLSCNPPTPPPKAMSLTLALGYCSFKPPPGNSFHIV